MTVPSQMSLRRIPDALHLHVARRVRVELGSAHRHPHPPGAAVRHRVRAPDLRCSAGWISTSASPRCPRHARGRALAHADGSRSQDRSRAGRAAAADRVAPVAARPCARAQRYRRRYHERTVELARMAGARAAEAVVATHVENALELAWLLKGVMAVNAATDHYLREFGAAGRRGADGHAAGAGAGGGRRAHRPGGRAAAPRCSRAPARVASARQGSPSRRRDGV